MTPVCLKPVDALGMVGQWGNNDGTYFRVAEAVLDLDKDLVVCAYVACGPDLKAYRYEQRIGMGTTAMFMIVEEREVPAPIMNAIASFMHTEIRCECGSTKCGLPAHSSWCPIAKRLW